MITDVELSGEDDYFVQIAAHVLVLHLFDGFLQLASMLNFGG